MPVITAEAKLYQSIRCLVVDKNISANLTATFAIGIIGNRTQFPVCDVFSTSSISLTPQRITNQGGGNGVFSGGFVTAQQYVITTVGTTGWNTIGGTGTYAVGTVLTAEQAGIFDNSTGRAQLYSWHTKSSLKCVFPTYVRIDIEKLMDMGLPEGQDCLVQLEEGFLLQDRGATKQASPFFEFANNLQDTPTSRNDNYVSFRTPKRFKFALSSVFSLPSLGNFRLKFFTQVLALQNAFSPVMTAQVTRSGTDDMQSAFTLNAIIGKLQFFAVQAVSIFEPNEPGGLSFLIGNGYEYPPGDPSAFLNPPPPWTFPGFLRIRNGGTSAMPATATLTADVFNLPYIFTAHNFDSAFTITPNVDAFKGVGTPQLQSASSMSITTTVQYNSTVPPMQSTATVFCRTPVQAQANIVCQSSLSATEGAKLELVWELLVANTTLGLVLKGASAMSLTVEWIYRAGTAGETPISTETLTSVGAFNSDIADAPVSYFYSKNFGALDTDEVTVRISGNYNGFQTSKNGVDTINGEINSDTALNSMFFAGNPYIVPGRSRLMRCVSWGNATNLNGAFANCINLNTVPNYIPKNSSVGTMFLNCVQMNSVNCIYWNTTTLTNFSGMFRGAIRFTQNIGSWNTSNVTNMRNMYNMQEHTGGSYGYPVSFPNTNTFNWNVTNVSRDNMQGMFRQHTGANLQLSSWCVSHIATQPVNWTFQTTGQWPTARRPQWGVAC